MPITIYLIIGLLLSAVLALKAKPLCIILTCSYWAIVTFWAINIIDPFNFHAVAWASSLKINFSYHVDGLSKLFSLLIGGIGIVVFIYSVIYTQRKPAKRKKLLSLLQLFAVSMLGIVLADDLLMLFLCWELTTISSYLLIQFNTEDEKANQAAFNSLFICVLGSLIMLVGFILLNNLSNTWSITKIIQSTTKDLNSLPLLFAFLFIFFGAITKSAQFPFYFWLTGAMRAPTPVSAYLHSATMVNAGIYLLARFHSLFSSLAWWYPVLSTFGLITMLISSLISLFQKDLKAILAYTTIFALGAMLYLLGGKSTLPIEAFVIFLCFHAVYKACIFMLVGTIDQEYQTRDLNLLTGIARKRLSLAVIAIITFSAMAGLPPFFGFTMKEIIFEAKLAAPSVSYFLMGTSILSSMLIAAASLRCLWYLLKKNRSSVLKYQKLQFGLMCPFILSLIILLFNVINKQIEKIVSPAIKAILTTSTTSFITPSTPTSFLFSLLVVVGGVILLFVYFDLKKHHRHVPKYLNLASLFNLLLTFLLNFGRFLTKTTQNQSLSTQLRLSSFSVFIFVLIFLSTSLHNIDLPVDFMLPVKYWVICLFLAGSALSLLASEKFLHNLISLSMIGIASTFFFVINGAVDVSLAQLLVEILTIIVLLMALKDVNIQTRATAKKTKYINGIISLGLGFIMSNLLLSLKLVIFNQELQQFYSKNSLTSAYGRNIVNVILVDFRSLDTFGEAIVVVAVAIAVSLLLKQYFLITRQSNHADH